MTTTEQQVKLAAKLYRCRDAAMKLYGTEYKFKIRWYIDALNAYAKHIGKGTLEAVIDYCSKPDVSTNGMAVMLFMAAAVEIIEPSKD
jgi:hypothetical protein